MGLDTEYKGISTEKKGGAYKERHNSNKQLSLLGNKRQFSLAGTCSVKEGCGTW